MNPADPDPYDIEGITDIELLCEIMERYSRLRVSKNFIMRDFLYSSHSMAKGVPMYPLKPSYCLAAARKYAAEILEPVQKKFGTLKITFGYAHYDRMDNKKPKSSHPHQWDRGTFGDEYYVRTDFVILKVADGRVDRYDAARWMMMNLNIDLLMQFRRSSAYCLTIGPKPRRVWIEWVPHGDGHKGSNKITYWGEKFWLVEFPAMPHSERPKFSPSQSEGKMWWGKKY